MVDLLARTGARVFGAAHYNWDQTLVAAVAALLAFVASWRAAKPYPGFLVMIGLGLVMLAASWGTYSPDVSRPLLRFTTPARRATQTQLCTVRLRLGLCLGLPGAEAVAAASSSRLTGVVFVVLIVGLAVILANFYYPAYRSLLGTISGRLDAVTSGLEFAVLAIGLSCILIGEPAVVTWMLLAAALLVASDMAYTTATSPPESHPCGCWGNSSSHPRSSCFPGTDEPSLPLAPVRARSGLSGVLILLSLGGMLLSVAIGLVSVHPVWKSFLAVLFVVVFVVAVVWLTDRFDEAVQDLETYTAKLHQQQLRAEDWREADTSIRTTLVSTGLGVYLDALRESGERLRETSCSWEPSVFIRRHMFGRTGSTSDASSSCRSASSGPTTSTWPWPPRARRRRSPLSRRRCLHANRHPRRHLAEHQRCGLCRCRHYRQDPNVLYELGVAHTLAKPVLIISRHAADIPIDLSTRRIILYGQSGDDWREDLGMKVTRAIKEILRMYGLSATEAELVEAVSQSQYWLPANRGGVLRQGYGESRRRRFARGGSRKPRGEAAWLPARGPEAVTGAIIQEPP